MSTLTVSQDDDNCHKDLSKGAFTIVGNKWVDDAVKTCRENCAVYGICATAEQAPKCKCDKIDQAEFFEDSSVCISKLGGAYSTTKVQKDGIFDVNPASNCEGGCANYGVCVGAGKEAQCEGKTVVVVDPVEPIVDPVTPVTPTDPVVINSDHCESTLMDCNGLKGNFLERDTSYCNRCIKTSGLVFNTADELVDASTCPSGCANWDFCVAKQDVGVCAFSHMQTCQLAGGVYYP